MKPPACRLCGVAHWGAEHVWPSKPKASPAILPQRKPRAARPSDAETAQTAPEAPVQPDPPAVARSVALLEATKADDHPATEPETTHSAPTTQDAPPEPDRASERRRSDPAQTTDSAGQTQPCLDVSAAPEPQLELAPPEPSPKRTRAEYMRDYMARRRAEKKAKEA